MPESLPSDRADPAPRLVLMGTGPFAVPAFEALRAAGYACPLVMTRPDRVGPGRKKPPKSPVRQWAESAGLRVEAPESINSDEARDLLKEVEPDLLVVCDYGQILRGSVLEMAPWGGINLHGSLLPAFRGAAPVQRALLSGVEETGVSVIHMTPRLDAGPVLGRRTTPIQPRETAGELETRLADLGIEATLQAVKILASAPDHRPEGELQDASLVSQAPRLSKSEGQIRWDRPAAEIDRHVRAMQPWPGAFTEIQSGSTGKRAPTRLVILEVSPENYPEPVDESTPSSVAADVVEPGCTRQVDGRLWVACRDGWLEVQRLKPAGKRELTAEQWLRGRPLEPDARLASGPADS